MEAHKDNWPLVSAADDAMQTFVDTYGDGDRGEYPPSMLLAALLAHAEYEGWDFANALAIAQLHGAGRPWELPRIIEDAREGRGDWLAALESQVIS